MAFSRSNQFRNAVSRLTNLRNLFSRRRSGAGDERKSRRLRIDPLEVRQMLSVTVLDPTDLLANENSDASLTTLTDKTWGNFSNQAIAADNDGDFVVTWVGYEPILNPVTGEPVKDPKSKETLVDANVFARYFTDEVQRITLPSEVLNDGTANHARFSLTYGGNEIQKLTLTQARAPYEYESLIVGSFRLGFDTDGDGVIGGGERVTVFFDEWQTVAESAENIELALQGLGGVLEDVEVVGVGSTEFLIHFGEVSGGENQPLIDVEEESWGFSSGFFPSVNMSTVREPMVITQYDWLGNDIGIPIIPGDLEQTETIIEQAFAGSVTDHIMGPVELSAPVSVPDTVAYETPEVQIRMIEGNVFEVTFVGTSGKQDQPELVIRSVTDEFANELTPASDAVQTLKEPSPEFRVNAPEEDNLDTQRPDIYNQFNPGVAMDVDGDFVITWEGEVYDTQTDKVHHDIFARRFTPQAIVPDSQIQFYSDGHIASASHGIPVQGVRPLADQFLVNTSRDGDQKEPSIGMDDQGNFTIAWCTQKAQNLSFGSRIDAQRFDRDGLRVGNQMPISTEQTNINFDPYVAMSDDGHLFIGWNSTNDADYYAGGPIAVLPFASLWAPDGTQLVTEDGTLSAGHGNVSAAFDSENNLLIVGASLIDADPVATSMGTRGFLYDLYDDAGNFALTPIRTEFAVNGADLSAAGMLRWPSGQGRPSAGIDADGDITIVYDGYGADTSAGLFMYNYQYRDPLTGQTVTVNELADLFAGVLDEDNNADLLAYFDPRPLYEPLYGADVDATIESVLLSAAVAGANDSDIARLGGILESRLTHLRSAEQGVMYTRLESDPRLGPSSVLATDAIVAAANDGNNARYHIIFDSSLGGGNVVLRMYHQDYTGYEDITVNIAAQNNVVNIGQTRDNIEAALEAADRTGGAWAPDIWYDAAVDVRWIDPWEIQDRVGTPWEIPVTRDTDLVYEITFQGSVHEKNLSLYVQENNLTTPGTDELQTIYVTGADPGYFNLGAMMPQGNNQPPVFTQTGDIYFDPDNPQLVAGAIESQLNVLFPGVVVTVDTATVPGFHVFDISFEGPSGGTNQPAITGSPSTTSLPALVGSIGWYDFPINGGSTTVPEPDIEQVNYADGGREHLGAWMAMEPDGDYVVAWTERVTDSESGLAQTNIRYRRFDESEDTAGPQVTDFLLASGERLDQGGQVYNSLSNIVVSFDEEMMQTGRYSVLDPSNWALLKDGVEVVGGIDSISFGMNQAALMPGAEFTTTGSNKWEAIVTFDGNGAAPDVTPLGEGHYEIVARDRMRDVANNTLLQSGYLANGGVYSRAFDVMPGGGPETQINDVISGDQVTRPLDDPSAPPVPRNVASDGDGDFVSVWSVVPDGSGRQGVYAKLYDVDWANVDDSRIPEGATPVKEIQVTSNPTARYASVAMDSDGDFVVVWSQLSSTTADSWDIYMRRFDAAGNKLAWPGEIESGSLTYGEARLVNTETANVQHYASVAMDVDGDYVVTWQSLDQDGSGYGVYAQRFGPNGEALGGNDEVQSIAFSSRTTGEFRLSFNGVESDIVRFGQNASKTAERIKKVLTDPATLGLDVEVTSISMSEIYVRFLGDNGSQNVPQMILADLVIDEDSDPGAYVRVSTKIDGAGGEFLVNDTVEGNQYHPSAGMSEDGQFVISWTSAGQDGDAAYETNIYAKTFVPNDVLRGTSVDASSLQNQVSTEYAEWQIATTDDPGNHVVPPSVGFDGVCMVEVDLGLMGVGVGSGSLLSTGRHILTAAHVVTDLLLGNPYSPNAMTVSFNTAQGVLDYGVSQVFVHPTWMPVLPIPLGVCDLAILVLDDAVPLTVERYDIYRNTDELGKVTEFVGYGTAGQGLVGNVLPTGTKRQGHNRIDVVGDQATDPYFTTQALEQLYCDFDDGTAERDLFGNAFGITDLGLGEAEASTCPGDSGGPWFINGQIAGVTSWGGVIDPMIDVDGVLNCTFGEMNAGVRVSSHADWVDTILGGGGGSEILVNTFTTGDQKWSNVAMDADGDFVVTWTSYGQDGVGDGPGAGYNGQNGVYARRFHADGTPVVFQSDGQIIPPAPALPPTPPAVGSPVVVSPELQAGVEVLVNDFAADDQQLSQVIMDASGDFAIVWESYQDRSADGAPWVPDNPNSFGVYAQQYAASQSLAGTGYYGLDGQIGGEIDVNVTKTGDQRAGGLALSDNGDMVVVWAGRGAYDNQGVFFRSFNKTEDDAGPVVADVVNAVERDGGYDLEQVLPGTTTSNEPTKFVISFSENLSTEDGAFGETSILNPSNWNLTSSGVFLSQAVVSIEFGRSQAFFHTESGAHDPITGAPSTKYEAVITFDGDPRTDGIQPLPEGEYILSISDQVEDIFGNPLDGDYDGLGGGSFQRPFYVGDQVISGDQPGDDDEDDDQDDPVFENTMYEQNSPAIAVGADGSYVIVGVSYGTATDPPLDDPTTGDVAAANIVARRFDRYGNQLGADFIVNSYIDGHQHSPDVACDQYGNFVVVWAGEGQYENDGVFARIFDAYGVPTGEQFRVNEQREVRQLAPSVGMDDAGNFVVGWRQYVSSRADEIFARRYDFSGEALSDPFVVNSHHAGNQVAPDVAMSGDGKFAIVWSSSNQDYYGWGIYGQRFNIDGSREGGEFHVNTTGDGHQEDPSIAMDADGDFVVTWDSYQQDGSNSGVYGRRFSNSGSNFIGHQEFRINQKTLGDQLSSSVSMADNGDFVVAWSARDQEGINFDEANHVELHDMGIIARLFKANGDDYLDPATGAPLGEFLVNKTTNGDQVAPAVAMDADGDFTIAWEGPDQFFAGYYPPGTVPDPTVAPLFSGTHDVFYRTYTINPGVGSVEDGDEQHLTYLMRASGGGYGGRGSAALPIGGSSLLVRYGTDGDDVFEFIGGATPEDWTIRVNGEDVPADARTSAVEFIGGQGHDRVVFTGTDVKDTAEFWAALGRAGLSSVLYDVVARDVEEVVIRGAGGDDTAILWDSAGDDRLVSKVESTVLSGTGYSCDVSQIENVFVYALQGGDDTARLYDSAGGDRLKLREDDAVLYRPGASIRAMGFEDVAAIATHGGLDIAYTYGSSGDDSIVSLPGIAIVQGEEYVQRMRGFDTVVAVSFGGQDEAWIQDSRGDDLFEGNAALGQMTYADGSEFVAFAFDRVHVTATDGEDRALLFGSSAGDELLADGDEALFQGDSFEYHLTDFDSMKIHAGGGQADTAQITDTPADDLLTVSDNTVTLSQSGVSLYELIAFEQVTAKKKYGGDDEAVEAVDWVLLEGDWEA